MLLLRSVCSLVLVCLLSGTLWGQSKAAGDNASPLDYTRDLAEQLRPFEEIYQTALRNSPVVREQDAQIESQLESTRLSKISLFNGVGASASYSAGNQSIIATGAASTDNLQISSGYRAGLQASVSLGDLLSLRGRIRLNQAGYRAAIAKRDGAKLGLRRELNQLYQTLLTSQRILKIYIQDEQVALVAFQTAEIEWKNGRLGVSEYSGASQSYSGARIKTESARGALLTNLFDLSTLVGVSLSLLRVY